MENDETPRGQRITRICFSLILQGAARATPPERCELATGRTATGDVIHSMWCEITTDFMTVTMMITAASAVGAMAQSSDKLMSFITKDLIEAKKKRVKKGTIPSIPEDMTEAEITKIDDLLVSCMLDAERVERRQKIYRISEITGTIDLFSYIEPLKVKGFSVRNVPLPETKTEAEHK